MENTNIETKGTLDINSGITSNTDDKAVATSLKNNSSKKKVIIIGALILIIVALIGVLAGPSKEERQVTEAYKNSIIEQYNGYGYENVDVLVECVAKVKIEDRHYYAFRTEVTWEYPDYLMTYEAQSKEDHSYKIVVTIYYKNSGMLDTEYDSYKYTAYKDIDDSYENALNTVKGHFKGYKKNHS